MIRRACLSLVLAAATLALAAAGRVERDLGGGLVYVRVHRLPADLPETPVGRVPPCVIDLRFVAADDAAAAAFAAWLKFRASLRSPVFVLANAETAEPLRKSLATRERGAGVMVVGAASEHLQPDVEVKTTADDERRAYDAVEKGAALTAVLADNPHKVRHDEASLVRETQVRPLPEVAEPGEGSAPADTPPIDATLQRALHLHRALVAMKKL